ncbi:hypothetical protein [Bacteroides pyogenes]|uniref:hypothetical protein n=1 Tax=Bacteroides pyogenes TaxID=310300 RepID=UPI002FDB12DC
MKLFLYIVCSMMMVGSLFTSCSNNEIDTPELTENEYPRIFGQWPEKKADGTLGEFNTPQDKPLEIKVQYTPSHHCEGVWYIDGVEVHRGVGYIYVPTTQGKFHIKLVVKTPKYETSREAIISVVEPTS